MSVIYGFKIIVEGDYACFTRPEMKVERVSYDVPTPSALEGMLKSVYWKPAIRYVIDRIIVFHPINFINVRRNEVKDKLPLSNVVGQMNNSEKETKDISIYADGSRNQRAALLLKNVKYGIEFHFELTGNCSNNEDECEEKHYCIIKRRLTNGQWFRKPCLGCSEFPASKIELVDAFSMDEISPELIKLGDMDLGYMLYGLKFEDKGKPINGNWDAPKFSDKADAVFYRPHMINGVIDVRKYAEDMLC